MLIVLRRGVLVEAEPDEGRIMKRRSFDVGRYNGLACNYTFSVDMVSVQNAYGFDDVK